MKKLFLALTLSFFATAFTSKAMSATSSLPGDALKNLMAWNGDYLIKSCEFSKIIDGTTIETKYCNANVVALFFDPHIYRLNMYLIQKTFSVKDTYTYGKLAVVDRIGCAPTNEPVEGLNDSLCYDVQPYFFNEKMDVDTTATCQNEKAVNNIKVDWNISNHNGETEVILNDYKVMNYCLDSGKFQNSHISNELKLVLIKAR